MANTTNDLAVSERENYETPYPVAAGAKLFRGAILGSTVVSNVIYARAYTAGDTIIGVNQNYVDNTSGANGAVTTRVRNGCFKFKQNATITGANTLIHFAKVVDDQTIALETTPGTATVNTIGRIHQVESDGVWVDTRRLSF